MNQIVRVQTFETSDLRRTSYRDVPTDQLAYVHRSRPSKSSTALPVGTQQRFLDAAQAAARTGTPLNTLLTIRWDSLFSGGAFSPLRCLPTPARIDHLVELLRKWLTYRDLPAHYIWVREAVRNEGEHWHIAFHLPAVYRDNLACRVAAWTGEARRHRRRSSNLRTPGEFACGELSSWHLAEDIMPEHRGYVLAAYLGKGEPSERLFRGKRRGNTSKPYRGFSFGGTYPDSKYDADQGRIEGTPDRGDRFFIAKPLQSLVKARLGQAKAR